MNDEAVAQAIVSYLAECPLAMDSPEGITRWWIARQQVRVSATTVTRVLRGLTEQGVLEELGEDEQRRYRLKRWTHHGLQESRGGHED